MAREKGKMAGKAKIAPEIKYGPQRQMQDTDPKMPRAEYNPTPGVLRHSAGLIGPGGKSVNKVYKTY